RAAAADGRGRLRLLREGSLGDVLLRRRHRSRHRPGHRTRQPLPALRPRRVRPGPGHARQAPAHPRLSPHAAITTTLCVRAAMAAPAGRRNCGDNWGMTTSGLPLGREVEYPRWYDAGLLFAIPRSEGRAALGLGAELPFTGHDRWHAYELSWLDPRGKPVVATATFVVPADSPNLVESKSFKLYLNSFNAM